MILKSLLRLILILSLSLVIAGIAGAQVVYESDRTNSIYDFLDELANLRLISINSAIKPYSRIFIAEKLSEALKNAEHLNKRQKEEVAFYLQDYRLELCDTLKIDKRIPLLEDQKNMGFGYSPIGFTYQKFPLTFTLRPVFGIQYYFNENGSVSYFSGGGNFFGYIGKHIGIYAGVNSRYQSQPLVKPEYFTEMDGYDWKTGTRGEVTNTEFTGGLTISWNWGDLGFIKDRPVWGNAEHGSNIFSGHAPSYPYIHLHVKPVKWIELYYLHGWLVSNVIDSSRSSFTGNEVKTIYRKKFIVANFITFIPWRGLFLSFGNSIIYNDDYPSVYYLIPFLFYNSVDAQMHAYNNNNGSNSQMFFDICSRQIKHLKLYTCLFIDELKVSRILDPQHYNFTSWKIGLKTSDLLIKNSFFIVEWTKTNPMTYKHFIKVTNFNNDNYNMGQYLRDNSQEFYLAFGIKPIQRLSFSASYGYTEHGGEYPYSNDPGIDVTAYPVLKDLTWQSHDIQIMANYELLNKVNCYVQFAGTHRRGDVQYGPAILMGNTYLMQVGLSLGL